MASITFTTGDAEAKRIAKAFGKDLGLGRDATFDEIKVAIALYVKRVVSSYELLEAQQAINVLDLDIT